MDGRTNGVQAWRALLLAHSAALRLIESDVLRGGRVPLSWYDVLLELHAAGEAGLRMRELADRVVLSRTRVSRLVEEMARAGLVARLSESGDRRVSRAVITAAGAGSLRETAPVYLESVDRHFCAHLSDDDAAVIARALLTVAERNRPAIDPEFRGTTDTARRPESDDR